MELCFSGLYGNVPVLPDPDVMLEGVEVFRIATSTKTKLNSVAFSPQANYTDGATAACRRS
jgi:hypothetical protein